MTRTTSITALTLALGFATSAHAYRIKAPWRGDSLVAGTYLASEGLGGACAADPTQLCALDLDALRWDHTLGDWSLSRVEGQATWTTRLEDPLWGMRLYSPVDGTVIACWAGLPDSDSIDCPGCDVSGNHLAIATTDGRLVVLDHLQKDSIPESLCPAPNRGTSIVAAAQACPEFGPAWTTIPDALRLPSPVAVRKGEHVGRSGSSGATAGDPRLHMHVQPLQTGAAAQPCVGAREPIELDEAWEQPVLAGLPAADELWSPLGGAAPTLAPDERTLLWPEPSGIALDSFELAQGSKPALAVTTDGLESAGVLAFKNADGDLQAIGFDFDGDGDLVLAEEHTGGPIEDLALARISASSHDVVAAVRNGDGKLQLIPYHVQPNHALVVGTAPAPSSNPIALVEATRSPNHPGIVTAIKDHLGRLRVQNFSAALGPDGLAVVARGWALSKTVVADLDIATITAGRSFKDSLNLAAFTGVVTVEQRASDDTAWVRTWEIDATGDALMPRAVKQVLARSNNAPYAVSDVAVTVIGDPTSREMAVVSVRRKLDDALIVYVYALRSNGAVERLSEWIAGPVTAIASAQVGTWDVLAGVRTSDTLSLISFGVPSSGWIGRTGTRDGAMISEIAIASDPTHDTLVSAAIDGAGDVSLMHLRSNYSAAL